MNIVVCIKQVPDTTEVRLDPVTGTLMREGVPSIINPDDKSGLEAALQLRDKIGGKVTVLTMGPPQADLALREALAMGADEAILLTDRVFGGADTWATSSALAGALKKINFDLVITGRQAIDGDTAQVGPQIAELLNIPQVSYAEKVDVGSNGALVITRQFEDRKYIIEVQTPCLITALSELNDPRYMHIRGVFTAYDKEVRTMTFEDIKDVVDADNLGLKGSPTRVKKAFTKQLKGQGDKFELSVDESVQVIMNKLIERHII